MGVGFRFGPGLSHENSQSIVKNGLWASASASVSARRSGAASQLPFRHLLARLSLFFSLYVSLSISFSLSPYLASSLSPSLLSWSALVSAIARLLLTELAHSLFTSSGRPARDENI